MEHVGAWVLAMPCTGDGFYNRHNGSRWDCRDTSGGSHPAISPCSPSATPASDNAESLNALKGKAVIRKVKLLNSPCSMSSINSEVCRVTPRARDSSQDLRCHARRDPGRIAKTSAVLGNDPAIWLAVSTCRLKMRLNYVIK